MKKPFILGAIIALISVLVCQPAIGDSLWNKDSASPYSNEKGWQVGDIVNVVILETVYTKMNSQTNTGVKDDLAAKFAHTIARLAPVIGSNSQVGGALSNSYTGSGQTARNSNIQARISAWVSQILPNGYLKIEGRHKTEVNDDTQEVTISGIIRPVDVRSDNTIYSYDVANVLVSVKGKGAVQEGADPGWITRILNWLF